MFSFRNRENSGWGQQMKGMGELRIRNLDFMVLRNFGIGKQRCVVVR